MAKTFGERLRAFRKARHLNQVQLAQAAGITQKYLSQLESGVYTNPTLELIDKLADALEVSRVQLLANGDPDRAAILDLWHRLDPQGRFMLRAAAEKLAYAPTPAQGHIMAEDPAPYSTD
jgi:XRE family transcriptional regulator of biofilm formation